MIRNMKMLLSESGLFQVNNLVNKYTKKLLEKNDEFLERTNNIKEHISSNEEFIGLEILIDNLLDEGICLELSDYFILYSLLDSFGVVLSNYISDFEVCDV